MTAKGALVLSLVLLGSALVFGFGSGSALSILVAVLASVPAGYGVWKGMQSEGQGSTAVGILLLLASLAAAVVLLIVRLF
jgi:hypothetical protein